MLKKIIIAIVVIGLSGFGTLFAVGGFSSALRGEEAPSIQALPESEVKIGYVNLQRSLEAFQPYREAQEKLREYQGELQQRIDEMEGEIEQLQEGIQFLAPERQQEVYEQLQMKMQEYRSLVHDSERRLDEREEELLQPIRERVKLAIGTVGDRQGLDVIKQFDGHVTDVLWVASRVDMTDAIISHLQDIE